MLEEVLRYLNNRFEVAHQDGTFAVSGGTIDVGAVEGQYFWLEGSVFNDGLHQQPDTDMEDEEFEGRAALLAVPRAVIDMADEIAAWCEANADAIAGPFQSESFGGYSYTLAGSSDEAMLSPWQAKFGPRLNAFRKVNRDWT